MNLGNFCVIECVIVGRFWVFWID
ncbi:hypothetical protein OIU79_028030 [Salix purpurea]|uniref:Uncharacterized protein n=1 Tax=Salix purpurea TaxID=77065 RepID=A0A9Q0VV56_SALPP|nr:hypothetical protein OIU79_028030 [Salix purpurea]